MFVPLLASFLLGSGVAAKHSFTVKVTGQGPAVILIPGLMCGGDVWDATVDHLKGRYTCHVLTLPGFGGVTPIKAPILSTVRDEIETYVVENNLERPILVGHSLGGMLSLWLASDKPSMFGGVISVDGVPYLGALADSTQTPAKLQPTVVKLEEYYKAMNGQRFTAANAIGLPQLITDPTNVAKVAMSANKSDPGAVGQAIGEMLLTDLRPEMSKLSVPMLLIVPESEKATKPDEVAAFKARYEVQVAAVPQHQVVIAPRSLHFVMLDAPKFFFDHLDEFLARLIRR